MQEAHAVDNDKYMQRVYVRDGPDRPIPSRNAVTLKTGLGSVKVIGNVTM